MRTNTREESYNFVWRFGLMVMALVISTKFFTLGPVSTWMGDCVGVQIPVMEIYLGLTNHPGQLSLAIPLCVGGMSTGDGLLATTREETASSA